MYSEENIYINFMQTIYNFYKMQFFYRFFIIKFLIILQLVTFMHNIVYNMNY